MDLRTLHGPRPPRDPSAGPSFLILFLDAVSRRPLLALAPPVAALALAVTLALVLPAQYAATSKFAPETPATGQTVGDAMARLGIAGLTGSAGESVEFYVELLGTRDLLEAAVQTTYDATDEHGTTRRGDLIELYEIEEETPARTLGAAVERLRDDLRVRTLNEAGVVAVTVVAPWPDLSVALNARLLALVNDFNLEKRRSRARTEREFIEGRRADAERELREAEAVLLRFLSQNHRYMEAAALRFEAERLEQQVGLKRGVFERLAQAYEQARVDEIRNTPAITVLETPGGARSTGSMSLPMLVLLALLAGVLLSAVLIVLREHWERERERHPDAVGRLERIAVSASRGAVSGTAAGA